MNEKNNIQNYEDIINLPYPVLLSHPRMPVSSRAAQFSPFAALTGYEEAIRETGRLTGARRELEEDAKRILDEKLQLLREQIISHPLVAITYFQPDDRKAGGAYVTVEGRIKKLDVYGRIVVMQDETRVPFGEIAEIEIEPCTTGNMPDS